MKKIMNYYWVIFLLLPCCLSGQSFSIGGGAEYNLSISTIGVNARAYYNIGEHFCVGPEFSIFATQEKTFDEGIEEIRVWEFNLNTHYIFEVGEHFGVYPIVGLNYTNEEETFIYTIDEEEEVEEITAWAANFGAGLHVPLERIIPFAEFHFTTGRLGEYIVTVGAFYTFNKKEEE